jgi:hypothetical protein
MSIAATAATTAIVLAFLSVPLLVDGQDSTPACSGLGSGIYYSYPKNTHGRYTFLREGTREKEFNLDTGDSTVWEIQWQGDCSYTMKFLSGNDPLTPGQQEFLKKHQVAFRVEKITGDYYIYAAYVDRVSHLFLEKDTIWLHEKVNPADNELHRFIPSEAALLQLHFTDTSRYAVIYLYRPAKLANSFSTFPVYCNDDLLWIARNKTGCLIRMLKEGEIELKSRLFKDEVSVKVNIQFGHVYYIKSMFHWGIPSSLYNFKLEMAAVGPEQGQPEFARVTVD